MRVRSPVLLHAGALDVYVQPLDAEVDLSALVQALPPSLPVVWLDSARVHPVTGRWSLLGFDPWLTLCVRQDRIELRSAAATRVWRANPFEALQQVLRGYRMPAAAAAPLRAVGLLGYVSYDCNRWIERLPSPRLAEGPAPPEMLWFGMRVVVLVDHLQRRSWMISMVDPHVASAVARRDARAALERARVLMQVAPPPAPCSSLAVTLQATTTRVEFEEMVRRALEHIRAGDIFQANVAQRFTAVWHAPLLPLYRRLRHINPSPFACFLSWEDVGVVSCSPERLVRVQEGRVDTRPIAGTRPRGATPEEDALSGCELLLSEKERAEHIMLVDLARNDLGRVCAPGTVAVHDLMELEAYSHVIHIVSEVAGTPRRGVGAVDVLRAVFPGGTITGCPKVRCMELLRELEPVARGLYTGSLGVLGFDGSMDLNIAIRTMAIHAGRLSFHVGAGIVADSDPAREYHETLHKAAALMRALDVVPDAGVPTDAARG